MNVYSKYLKVCIIMFSCFTIKGNNPYSAGAHRKTKHKTKVHHYLGQNRPNESHHPQSSVLAITDKPSKDIVTPSSGSTATVSNNEDHHDLIPANSSSGAIIPQGKLLTLQEQTELFGPLLAPEWDLYNKAEGTPFVLLSGNLHLFPPIIHKAGSPMKNEVYGSPVERATKIGKALVEWEQKKQSDDPNNLVTPFDIVVVQEAWDADCRKALYQEIKDIYPYMVEDKYFSTLAYVGLDVILGSGLAIYSKYPFEQLLTRDEKTQNYMLEAFNDYRGDEAFAHKGFLLVKIIKDGNPIYIATTHLQAGGHDWDKWIPGTNKSTTRDVAKLEMEQIKSAIEFVIMNDFYRDDLNQLLKENKTDYSGVTGMFNKYVWNFFSDKAIGAARYISGKYQEPALSDEIEAAKIKKAINDFVKNTPDFWEKAYVFLAGDFNIGIKDLDYQDIKDVFGETSLTLLKAAQKESTSFAKDPQTGILSNLLKDNNLIDHILSFGKKPAEKKDGTIVGGSWACSIFDNTMTDHVAIQLAVKMVKRQ